jgi:signal transduction histidine kinase/DNA-binding response OmpR family regulator
VIEVPSRSRDLQIRYTALSFIAAENIRFRYRLDPYDRGWVDADTRRTAYYTKVPPGRYTFRVMASTGDDVWDPVDATLEMHVAPRFFETWWFKGLAILAAALLVWGLVRWRVSRLRFLAAQLQQRVDERTVELREREALLATQNVQLANQTDQLKELDRAKTNFFANVSHELRTPLTLTIGPLEDVRSQLITANGDGSATRAEAVPRIDMALRNSRRLFQLVNQLLDVAKLEAGRMPLRARRGDLNAFVRGVAAAFTAVAERRGMKFGISVAAGPVDASFDPDALEKVITNLLSNAFKFTPDGGTVTLAVECDAAAADNPAVARIHVADSGPGVQAAHLPHVFDRFYQVDATNARSQPGTGIGLSLARELAELHGGSLTVQSEGGRGAVFTVTLPLGDLTVDEATTPAPTATEDIATLLIVDDNADMRRYVRERFESRFRVVEGADGSEGIAHAREIIPDLIICDVMMPGIDGHGLCDALRSSHETDFIPIIMLTGQAGQDERIAGLGRGADDYITKPFDMRELEARVDNLLASRRRLRERFRGLPAPQRPAVATIDAGDQAFLDRLFAVLDANLDNPDFGVAELADAVFQDRSHLFRRTRELLNEAPSDLLRRLRLERAASMLTSADDSVAEVAYGVGFNSVSHFCRSFRESYGVTPSEYRARAGQPVPV